MKLFVDVIQTFHGCDTNFIKQDCGRDTEGSTWTVTTLENVYWEDNEYALLWVANEEVCKQACLEDCDCMAALFKGESVQNRSCLSDMGTELILRRPSLR